MDVLLVLGMGALRILQSHFNKQTSGYMNTTERFIRCGTYFEFMPALFALLYLCISGFHGFGGATLICSAIGGLCYVCELTTALMAMRRAPLVLCTLCSLGGYIILPSVVGIFFFGEPMSWLQWLGVMLFFVAVWFISSAKSGGGRKMTAVTAAVLVINFLFNGFCGVVSKYFAVRVANSNPAFYSCLSYAFGGVFFCIVLAVFLLHKRRKGVEAQSEPLPKKVYLYGVAVGAVCSSIGFLSTFLAKTVPIVILNTVPSAIGVIGCLLLGGIMFGERITARNIVGVIVGILSAVLIVVF